jgi:hypothetical protein
VIGFVDIAMLLSWDMNNWVDMAGARRTVYALGLPLLGIAPASSRNCKEGASTHSPLRLSFRIPGV